MMTECGFVAARLDDRFTNFQLPGISFLTPSGEEPNRLMAHIIEVYWKPQIASIDRNLFICGASPYIFVDQQVEFDGTKFTEQVPQVLQPGDYDMLIGVDKQHRTTIKFAFKHDISSKIEIHYVAGKDFTPSQVITETINTGAGRLLSAWEALTARREQVKQGYDRLVNPPIFLEHEMTTMGAPPETVSTTEYVDEREKRMQRAGFGYEALATQIIRVGSLRVLPYAYKVSKYQDSIPAQALDISAQEAEWKMLVDNVIRIPHQARISSAPIASAQIDETRTSRVATLKALGDVLESALEDMFKTRYGDEVVVSIPFRSQLDFAAIDYLLVHNWITAEEAKSLALGIVGIHPPKYEHRLEELRDEDGGDQKRPRMGQAKGDEEAGKGASKGASKEANKEGKRSKVVEEMAD